MHHPRNVLSIFLTFISSLVVAQNRDFRGVTVRLNGGVEFVISDALGRRSGYDPKLNEKFNEINDSYGVFSIDSEDPKVEPPEPVNEFETRDPVDGKYTLTLHGTKASQYRLSIIVTRSLNESTGKVEGMGFDFAGVIDSGGTVGYAFEFRSTARAPFPAAKIVALSSLREDLENAFKLKLLGEKDLYKDLTHRLDKLEKYLAHKDSSKAREELEDFKEKIEDVRKQTVKKEQKKERREKEFLMKDAYQILQEDVDALLKQLPQRRKGKGWDHDDRDRP